MTDDIEREIQTLIRKLSGYRKPIEATTAVNFDVGLDGDDAYELLETIQKHFGTRFDSLNWHKYFRDEGNFCLLSLWLRKFAGYKDSRQRLTFQRLLEAVLSGVWVES